MQRVAIMGCGGSGKSTLAVQLGARLGLPVYHLDRIYWKPGWVEMDRPEFIERQEQIMRQPQWIIDGNYSATAAIRLAACDTVIFLDLPTTACLRGVLRRWWTFRGKTRPDIGDGCTEKIDWEFIHWILTFRRRSRPGLLTNLEAIRGIEGKTLVHLRSRSAISAWLASLPAARSIDESAMRV